MSKAVTVSRPRRLRGTITPPGDKSISHRSSIFNAVANGTARVTNYSTGQDCASTLRVLRGLGVNIDAKPSPDGNGDTLTVHGAGMDGFREPDDVLDAGNSGTTTRLMSGLLAGRPFQAILTGDASIRSRPMGRVIEPLRQMGAEISARKGRTLAPIVFHGGSLRAIDYAMPVASAQVKSCLLLAGLRAEGRTQLRQPAQSRDHTERMLSAMGARVGSDGLTAWVEPGELRPLDMEVPGDISSAAFWLVAAAIHPDAEITVRNVGLNPSRTGVLTVLREMGADFEIRGERSVAGEPAGDLIARSSELRGVEIAGDIVPILIDEIPVLSVAAALADGKTVIRDAAELRVKETDRISATATWLKAAGISVQESNDGMTIVGGARLKGAHCQSFDDHRIAMSLAIGGLVSDGPMKIEGAGAADISYPTFWRDLELIGGSLG
ncbi:MAG: 3-phosphoshikimate 1-carboxyvinyltransferase [SAR202 cluster bacterium]|nr:3-phosphoshikimate 1-carboxyvinyltransferase [SAR202 cluster bacterium]